MHQWVLLCKMANQLLHRLSIESPFHQFAASSTRVAAPEPPATTITSACPVKAVTLASAAALNSELVLPPDRHFVNTLIGHRINGCDIGYTGWSAEHTNNNITWKELYAITAVVNTWSHLRKWKKVLFHCDNQSVCAIW